MTPTRGGRGSPIDGARDAADDVREELETHLEGTVELLMERGWREDDARAEARRRFGDVDRWRRTLEGMRRGRDRRRRVGQAVRSLGATLVSAGRSLRRRCRGDCSPAPRYGYRGRGAPGVAGRAGRPHRGAG